MDRWLVAAEVTANYANFTRLRSEGTPPDGDKRTSTEVVYGVS